MFGEVDPWRRPAARILEEKEAREAMEAELGNAEKQGIHARRREALTSVEKHA